MVTTRGRQGFALVSVLWILVAVGAVSVAFHSSARTHRRGVSNASNEARARWAARGGLARVLDAIERDGMGRKGGGAPEALAGTRGLLDGKSGLREVDVFVEIVDARSRVHLNEVTPSELTDFLGAAFGGVGPDVLGLRDGILDWRDRDDHRRPAGAEAREYRLMDRPGRVANGPFEFVTDLADLWGMDERAYRVLAPLVTVAGDGLVNVNGAHPAVLASLPGIDLEAASLLAQARVQRPFTSVFDMIRVLPLPARRRLESYVSALQDRVAFSPRELEIHVTARAPGSAVTARVDATVRLLARGLTQVIRVVES